MAMFARSRSFFRPVTNFLPNRNRSSSSSLNDAELGSYSDALTTPRLFISGLSRMTTEEKLREAFSPFGRLLEAKVITDSATGRSKGFGFVTYASAEEASGARQEMNAKFLDGWVIFVDPAKPRFKPRLSSPSPGSWNSGRN